MGTGTPKPIQSSEFLDEVHSYLDKGIGDSLKFAVSLHNLAGEFRRRYAEQGGTDPEYKDLAEKADVAPKSVIHIMEAKPEILGAGVQQIVGIAHALGLRISFSMLPLQDTEENKE